MDPGAQDCDGRAIDEAEKILRQLVEMGRNHSYEQWTSFDPRLVGDDAKANLGGACLVRQAKLDEAVVSLQESCWEEAPRMRDWARANMEAIEQFMAQAGSPGGNTAGSQRI